MTVAYIGLGSNLNDPKQQILHALSSLRKIPDAEVVRVSSLYRSKPLGPEDQPDYVNAAAMLETSMSAFKLLTQLHQIEQDSGRIRDSQNWGPRIIDLDLLLFGDEKINEENLTVPHPEISNRNFVLYPLIEMTPDLTIPGQGAARDLLEQVAAEGLNKIVCNE